MNAEIYPCAKRACATLGAIRKSRIGLFQIRRAERKKQMKACDEATARKSVDIIYGRIEHIHGESAKMSGITRKQYIDWERIECMETNPKGNRGSGLSIRKKERMG